MASNEPLSKQRQEGKGVNCTVKVHLKTGCYRYTGGGGGT